MKSCCNSWAHLGTRTLWRSNRFLKGGSGLSCTDAKVPLEESGTIHMQPEDLEWERQQWMEDQPASA